MSAPLLVSHPPSVEASEIDMKSNPHGMMPGSSPDIGPPFVPSSGEKPDTVVALPPKVPDAETWGRTIITWGQYKGCNVSYEELYNRTDEKAVVLDIRNGAWLGSTLPKGICST